MGAKKGERGEATLDKRAGLSDDDLKWVLERKSVLFYGDIDCYSNVGAFLWDAERADLREELAGQIYVNSRIAKRKMALNRWSLVFLLLFMLLCALVMVIGSGR